MSKLIDRENKGKLGFKNLLSRKHKRGLTRRDFIKSTVAAGTAASWMGSVTSTNQAYAQRTSGNPGVDKVYLGICPYCSVGCTHKIGVKATTTSSLDDWDDSGYGAEVVDIWGDEYNVISSGGLCSKGAAAYYYHTSPRRETMPWVKKAGGNWRPVSWDKVITGGTGFTDLTGGAFSDTLPGVVNELKTVIANDPRGLAFLGSSHMTNEECYLYRKFIALCGTNNIEHQARI